MRIEAGCLCLLLPIARKDGQIVTAVEFKGDVVVRGCLYKNSWAITNDAIEQRKEIEGYEFISAMEKELQRLDGYDFSHEKEKELVK